MNKSIRVAELFAGVGGFRLGLEGWKGKSSTSNYSKKFNSRYSVVWSNQWEPSTKVQHASIVYESQFGKDGHNNQDIETVEVNEIPDHDLLVGGFPCQDYSVATTLKNSKGLLGKKGVLWWSIHRILSEKAKKPDYLFLENVDRLLISPSSQRGRDFAVILKSLDDLNYAVEWRVINAADYGMPQRRKRVFIVAYRLGTKLYNECKLLEPLKWIVQKSVINSAFPVQNTADIKSFELVGDIVTISADFNRNSRKSMFENSGFMIDGKVHTIKTAPAYDGEFRVLKDVLLNSNIPEEFYISSTDLEKWIYLKGPKKEKRQNALGFEYNYNEGGMTFPDSLDRASRTIITGEGGKSPSRFKHVISDTKGLRRLTPVELERLNMFPDDHTAFPGFTDAKRAFFMGNALVVGVIEKIGRSLAERI